MSFNGRVPPRRDFDSREEWLATVATNYPVDASALSRIAE